MIDNGFGLNKTVYSLAPVHTRTRYTILPISVSRVAQAASAGAAGNGP